ncbi:MAG: hypothetical protein K940chlam8_01296 [Chlamydiae bacterium]|nr:hypothetical protein [Chlamydiota bacterium]
MTYTSQVDMESKVLTLELNDSCEVDFSPPKWYSSIFGSSSVLKTDEKVAEFMKKFWPNTDFLYVFTKNPESKRLEDKFEIREKNSQGQSSYTVFKGEMSHTDNTSRYCIKHSFTGAEMLFILTGEGPFKVGNQSDFSPQAKRYFARQA